MLDNIGGEFKLVLLLLFGSQHIHPVRVGFSNELVKINTCSLHRKDIPNTSVLQFKRSYETSSVRMSEKYFLTALVTVAFYLFQHRNCNILSSFHLSAHRYYFYVSLFETFHIGINRETAKTYHLHFSEFKFLYVGYVF